MFSRIFNKKGQAAVTDAIIFLTIVGVVSTMIIVSAMNYGLSITTRINENYEITYLDSALKTMYMVNYGRDAKDIFNTDVGDYLMTKVKEEYSEGELTENTKKSLFAVLDNMFLALPQKSYLFAIMNGDEAVFLGIRTAYDDGSDSFPIYLECKPSNPLSALPYYLSSYKKDVRITTGKAVFYKGLIGSATTVKGTGTNYLAMWVAQSEFNEEPDEKVTFKFDADTIEGSEKDMNCYVATYYPPRS